MYKQTNKQTHKPTIAHCQVIIALLKVFFQFTVCICVTEDNSKVLKLSTGAKDGVALLHLDL